MYPFLTPSIHLPLRLALLDAAAEMMANDHHGNYEVTTEDNASGDVDHEAQGEVGKESAGIFTKMLGKRINKDTMSVLEDSVSNVDGPNGANNGGAASGGRRPSMVASAMRRISLSPSPAATPSAPSAVSGGLIQPESVHDEEWAKMSKAKRRSSLLGATIDLNGQQVKVEDLQDPEKRVVLPFNQSEDSGGEARQKMVKVIGHAGEE